MHNTRYLTVSLEGQKVSFKYRVPANDIESRNAFDLQANGDIRLGLLAAFVRAKAAVKKAASEFTGLSMKGSSGLFGWSKTMKAILHEDFRDPATNEELKLIGETFAKIHAGFQDHVVLSDTLGRESEAEGYVMLRGDQQQRFDDEMMDAIKDTILLDQKALERRDYKEAKKFQLEWNYAKGLKMHEILSRYTLDTKRSMHIRFQLAEALSVDGLARIIVHEASHRYASTGDFAYKHQVHLYEPMSSKEAVLNADSYAYAAIELLRGGLTSARELSSEEPRAVRAKKLKSGKLKSLAYKDLATRAPV